MNAPLSMKISHSPDQKTPSPAPDKQGSNALIMALVSSIMLAGCTIGPKYERPVVETPKTFQELTPEQFKDTDGWKQAEPKETVLRGQWWELFHDPELNALEAQVNISNQSVAAATAAFISARSVVKQAQSQYYPTVAVDPSVSRTHPSKTTGQTGSGSRSSAFTTYSLPFDASWELDLWGNIKNTVKANLLEAQASAGDLESVRLSVQAELAIDYYQARAQDAQKQILDSTVRAFQESLQLTKARFDTGLASDEDVAQAETQLTTTQAQATDLGILRAQYEHAIALLIGRPASSYTLSVHPLTANPVAVPFGIPSALLERRPDIAAAERRVAEANARIGVAKAAFYPTLTLSGSAGFESARLGDLASWPSLAWSVGATLAQTLFDGGKRNAVTEQAQAVYQQTVANYRLTVLTAFQEVEDNLSTLRILSRELEQQHAAVKSSQRLLALSNDRYKLGIDSYLNVITAQATLLSNQRADMNLQMQQMVANVQLIKALGGGWDVSQMPSDKQLESRSSTAKAAGQTAAAKSKTAQPASGKTTTP